MANTAFRTELNYILDWLRAHKPSQKALLGWTPALKTDEINNSKIESEGGTDSLKQTGSQMKRDTSSLGEGKLAAWLDFPHDNPRIYDYLGRE